MVPYSAALDLPHALVEWVTMLIVTRVTAAVDDGGTHLSVHLTDHQAHALVLVLSSGPHTERPDDGSLLQAVAAQGAADCGTETGQDGRRRWALLDLTLPPPAQLPASARRGPS